MIISLLLLISRLYSMTLDIFCICIPKVMMTGMPCWHSISLSLFFNPSGWIELRWGKKSSRGARRRWLAQRRSLEKDRPSSSRRRTMMMRVWGRLPGATLWLFAAVKDAVLLYSTPVQLSEDKVNLVFYHMLYAGVIFHWCLIKKSFTW